ncbi:MAG: FKBP-type peptidyl-prolyl cis-trans isomerase [Planctomycetaceae bacterium]
MPTLVNCKLALLCLVAMLLLSLPGCQDKKTDAVDKRTGLGPGPVDPDAPEEFTTTESGLKYRIRRKSDDIKPEPLDGVAMHYRGWLDNGQEFENTYAKGSVVVKRMVELLSGWKEGMQLIGRGGMIELEIPAKLAFGHEGQSAIGIPPHATLHAQIELLDVRKYRNEPGKADADAPKEFTETGTGLKYRIRRKGNGKKPTLENIVYIRVKTTLEDGSEVENSYHSGFPTRAPASGGPPGVVEGIQLVEEGGMIELVIPPELGIGDQKHPKIPPNSTLKMLIELDEIQ